MAFFRGNLFTHLKILQTLRGIAGTPNLLSVTTTFAKQPECGRAPEEEESRGSCDEADPKQKAPKWKTLMIYRYNPETPEMKPYLQKFTIDINRCAGGMVLDALAFIKSEMDSSLSYRRSCREAICGCCAINIRGVNALACITPVTGPERALRLYPLPHMYVLRDLVVDQSHFFAQYARVEPWLQRKGPVPMARSGCPPQELPQSERDRAKLDGLYECILCGCCSASCPPYWWHYEKFLGAAVLMQAYRWIIDSRDECHQERLCRLNDYFSVYRCHTIMNCTNCCPKKLNPGRAIAELKRMLIGLKRKEVPDLELVEDKDQSCQKDCMKSC